MGRRLERVEVASQAINTIWTALTCPSNHKLEVLETICNVGATANRQCVEGFFVGSDFWQTAGSGAVPAFTVVRVVHNAIVLYPGDEFVMQVAGGGSSAYTAAVMYVDVDFT